MIYLKDINNNVYTLNGHAVFKNDVETYSFHIPFTAQNFAASLGLKLQEITITGYVQTRNSIPFDKIKEISFDNWATYQTVYVCTGLDFSTVPPGFWIPFQMTCLVSPLRLGAVHSSGTMWGLATTPTLTNNGNYTAYVKITYQGPKLYFPLTQNLIDFAGASITFTNPNSKTYKGVVYSANVPIFNEGLYLSNEFQDVAKLNFVNLTTHTIIAQIKSTRYPSDWVVGGGGGNLLTKNQSNAETDLTGIDGNGGTLSRTTTAGEFYAGTAGFKIVSTGSNNISIYTSTKIAVTAGKYYCFSAYVKASTTTKSWKLQINWYDADSTFLGTANGSTSQASTSFTRLFFLAKAPTGATQCMVVIPLLSANVNDVLYADNLMLERVNETNITIWDDGSKNKLYIDIPNGLLKWTDYTSTISCTFPTNQFLLENSTQTRKVITIVVIHNGETKELHCKYEGGTFSNASGTLNSLVWTNPITLGRFDGSLFNLIQYPYVLTASEYGNLNFTLNPLRFNDFYIANKTAGTIVYEDGKLTDENGNDISGLVSGSVPSILASGTVQMKDGLSARWKVEIKDTYYP